MSRFSNALLAGLAASALIAAAPPTTGKPASKTHSSTHGSVHASTHAQVHATTHATTHTTVHATTPAHPIVRAPEHATTKHTTVQHYENVHHGSTARYAPVRREQRATVVSHADVARIEDESGTRIREIAHTTTPIGRVKFDREAVRTIRAHRTALVHPVFVTGTIVSRASRTVVVRTASGSTVTVLTQSVPVAPSVLAVGSTVVLPVQYVNSGLVLMPAYTVADETQLAQEPMLAPCAINDNDADDAGDTGYYAPPGACYNNDGDADDGYNFSIPALPSSFAAVPQVFSSSFAPVVASGFVVAQEGSNLVLMTPDFKPMVVNASPALSSGATNGSLTPGRYVTVYGYDLNNTLVATSLM